MRVLLVAVFLFLIASLVVESRRNFRRRQKHNHGGSNCLGRRGILRQMFADDLNGYRGRRYWNSICHRHHHHHHRHHHNHTDLANDVDDVNNDNNTNVDEDFDQNGPPAESTMTPTTNTPTTAPSPMPPATEKTTTIPYKVLTSSEVILAPATTAPSTTTESTTTEKSIVGTGGETHGDGGDLGGIVGDCTPRYNRECMPFVKSVTDALALPGCQNDCDCKNIEEKCCATTKLSGARCWYTYQTA